MERPGAWVCDTLLPDVHERPAVERDPVAHHAGRTSILEQTDGRAMDAQPKPNRRLVPGHLTAAEHVITSVSGDKPGTSSAVFIGASGGCQRASRWSRQVRGRHRDAIPATPRPPTSALHPAGSTCFRRCRIQAGIGRSVGSNRSTVPRAAPPPRPSPQRQAAVTDEGPWRRCGDELPRISEDFLFSMTINATRDDDEVGRSRAGGTASGRPGSDSPHAAIDTTAPATAATRRGPEVRTSPYRRRTIEKLLWPMRAPKRWSAREPSPGQTYHW
jgi:hypothetical protein